MAYHNIEDIQKDFGYHNLEEAEIKKQLKALLHKIHPDRNNGSFKNNEDRAKYDKVISALEFLEESNIKSIAVKTELTALTKVVSELINVNRNNDAINKYEVALSRKVESSIKLYQSSNLFSKITSTTVTAIVTFIWLSPKTFADNPIIAHYIGLGKNVVFYNSISYQLITLIWLLLLSYTIMLWAFLIRRERRVENVKSNLNLEETQINIFEQFTDWYTRRYSRGPIFNKSDLIGFIISLKVNGDELQPNEERHKNSVLTESFKAKRYMDIIDKGLAQSLSDIIIARAEKKGVIKAEKSKSLTDWYRFIDETEE